MEEEKRMVNWRAVIIMFVISATIVMAVSATVLFVLTYETEYHLEGTIVSIDQENEHLVIERTEGGIVVIQASDYVLAKATYFQLEGQRATFLVDMNGDYPDEIVEIVSFIDGR